MVEVNRKLLKMRILQSGLSYGEIAHNTDVTRNTIHNLIIGKTQPSHYLTTRLTITLKLSLKDFIAVFYPNIKFEEELLHD